MWMLLYGFSRVEGLDMAILLGNMQKKMLPAGGDAEAHVSESKSLS
jgi:hypothetical protein